MSRGEQLSQWLAQSHPEWVASMVPASSDASFRRYFRITHGAHSLIVMDAPPDKEDSRPFVAVAALLTAAGVHVPEILRADLSQGFLLLSDLGRETYLDALPHRAADALYRDAFAALVKIQAGGRADGLPPYDEALLGREVALFREWYLGRHRQWQLTPAEDDTLRRAEHGLVAACAAQPSVFVHRDYHSRNLMVAEPNPGILDFQDAVLGPVTYDAVSLLKDAYVDFPEDQVLDWLVRYWEAARRAHLPVAEDFGAFYRDFEWMGMQRHLKVAGIFARLYHRDGKPGYLDSLPRVMGYLRRSAARYREFLPLSRLLERLETGDSAGVGYTF